MDLRDKAMAFGNANNAAATIYAALHADPDEPFNLDVFEAIRDAIFEGSVEVQERLAAEYTASQFPGAQVQVGSPIVAQVPVSQFPAPATAVAPAFPAPAPAAQAAASHVNAAATGTTLAGPGPAPIPGASVQSSGVEDLWKELFTDASKFYDNRENANASINGGTGPDFKRKSDKKGLWINGKAPTPAWVKQQLGLS